VEWDEAVEAAAAREFLEETGLRVALGHVLAVHSNFHNPQQHTVGIWYRGERIGGTLRAGGDLRQVEFFSFERLPPLIFPTDQLVVNKIRPEI
jgi:ADP-ribose pyrophosphatase YjhB (NUDIX family)